MIVKNEENCLERCLQSVQGIVDEIIIVDTGSIDKTKEIAKKYTDQVYDFKWIDDFSAARNFALDFASSEYILQLDADEVLHDTQKLLLQGLDKDFYYIRIKNDLGSGLYLSHQFIRLFKNSPDIRYKGALHEQVPGDYEIERYGSLPSVEILHEGYKTHLVNSKQKAQRNLNILLREIKEKPTAFNYYNLGMQYILERKYNDALKVLKKSYSLGSNFAFSQKVILDIMKCLQSLGQYHDAIIIGEDAVKLYEDVPDYWYQMGLVYLEWGLLKDAERCYEKCLEIGEESTHKLVQHYDGTGSYLAQAKLAEIRLVLDDRDEALQYILSAVKASPDTLALFDIFLSIYPNASNEELFRTISSIWPFSSQRYIELISYLYRQRNPLINEFLNYFDMDVDYPVSVFKYIVAGNYEQAVTEIVSNKERSAEQGPDLTHNLIFLAFATQNPSLVDQFSNDMSLSSKELKWLKKLLENQKAGEVTVSQSIQLIWKQLVTDIINLQKYELMDLLITATDQPELRLLIAESLQSIGLDELALEVLVETSSEQISRKIYMVAAKSLRKLGSMEDALFYLKKAEKIKPDFDVLFEQWRIYTEYDKKAELDLLQKMHSLYPGSTWAKAEVNKRGAII
ncbi:glycosyltransferase [Paenibacillus sp.]|jgi:glycosyltransferase involved in cell wall biosynthesis|uniref:glycosyltransferase n=1 Tax=Paenibacillus sp. TaxID=58172 RepID=UPI00283A9047|nr:glycosyltransferase [Paenibacillus sp.]